MGNVDIDETMILKSVLDCSDVGWIQVCQVQWWDLLNRVITLFWHKKCRNSWIAERIPAFQEVLWSTDLGTPSLITPWKRVFLEKLLFLLLANKCFVFFGTPKFIVLFTKTRHLSVFLSKLIRSTPSHSISLWSILIYFPIYTFHVA